MNKEQLDILQHFIDKSKLFSLTIGTTEFLLVNQTMKELRAELELSEDFYSVICLHRQDIVQGFSEEVAQKLAADGALGDIASKIGDSLMDYYWTSLDTIIEDNYGHLLNHEEEEICEGCGVAQEYFCDKCGLCEACCTEDEED